MNGNEHPWEAMIVVLTFGLAWAVVIYWANGGRRGWPYD